MDGYQQLIQFMVDNYLLLSIPMWVLNSGDFQKITEVHLKESKDQLRFGEAMIGVATWKAIKNANDIHA